MEHDARMDIVERRSYQVAKANEFIQKARYNLTLKELKLLGYLISRIKPNDPKDKEYEMSIKEYCEICGIQLNSGGNYDSVKKGLQALRNKSFWLVTANGHIVCTGWIERPEVIPQSGRVIFRFSPELQEYLFDLRGNYTQYELLATLPMKSAYSIRLYELLKSYSFNHTDVALTIDELRDATGSKGLYPEYRDLRRKVIDVAVREINLYTDLDITYTKEQVGRTVKAVRFYMSKKDMDGRIDAYSAAEKALDGNDIPGQMTISDWLKGK